MTQEYYSIITNTGLAKNAAASLGGAPIDLTHLAIGDSNGTSYNPLATATSLQNELHRTTLTYVEIDEENPNQVIVEAIIDEGVGSFYVREVGIFDADGDLFAIGKFPETFKPALPTGSGKRLYVRMILGFSGTPQVNLVLSDNLNYDPNFSENVFDALAQKLAKAQNLADVEDASEARNNLGLEIGADVQAFAANLAAFAALVGAINKIPYFTGAGQLALADLFSNRNILINGDFNIWQRGTSFVSVVDQQYTVDRWVYRKINTTAVHDISRSTDVPTVAQAGRKFNYSVLIDCQTIDASISSTDIVVFFQRIEGYNFLAIAQKTFTFGFWVKATKTGIYCVSFTSGAGDYGYVAEYTINASDTWEYKKIIVPATPSAGAWNYTNGTALNAVFCLAAGSNYQTTPNAWQNGDFSATSNQVNSCDNAANNFRICGVQLESGSVATPFEQRSIQHELQLCQRYFERSYNIETPTGTVEENQAAWGNVNSADTTLLCVNVDFKSIKRTTPSITAYNTSTGAAGSFIAGSTSKNVSTVVGGTKGIGRVYATSGMTAGVYARFHWVADAEL
jgi:hypothetical protein